MSHARNGSSSVRSINAHDSLHRRSMEYRDADDVYDNIRQRGTPFRLRQRKSLINRLPPLPTLVFWILVLGLAYTFGRFAASPSTAPSTPLNAFDKSVQGTLSGPRDTFYFSNGTLFNRPVDLRIVGIIFFGRRQFVDILECYLRKNLKVNGGMLDEVHFLMHTDIAEDKDWLRNLIKDHQLQQHFKLKAEETGLGWSRWRTFDRLYRDFMTDPDTIYVKIDDDVIYVDDYAIPELVRTVIEHPEAHSAMSNNINNKWNYWLHHRSNVIWPYLAETEENTRWPIDQWRPSQLPKFKGDIPNIKKLNFSGLNYPAPTDGHRWLPLQETQSHAESVAHTPWGPWLPNPMFHERSHSAGWAVTAQAHYSFFENLERGLLHKYYFGNGEDRTWNLWYSRYNINFFAIKGSTLLLEPFWESFEEIDKGDEFLLTTTIPAKLRMPVLISTRSLVSHYSFRGDRKEMLKTDVLDRYRALANEFACGADNQKLRFGQRLGPHHLAAERKEGGSEDEANGVPGDDEDVGDGPSDKFNPDEDDDEYGGDDAYGDDEDSPAPAPKVPVGLAPAAVPEAGPPPVAAP